MVPAHGRHGYAPRYVRGFSMASLLASVIGSGTWWPEALIIAIGVVPYGVLRGDLGFAILGAAFLGLAIIGRNRARKTRTKTN